MSNLKTLRCVKRPEWKQWTPNLRFPKGYRLCNNDDLIFFFLSTKFKGMFFDIHVFIYKPFDFFVVVSLAQILLFFYYSSTDLAMV